VTWSAWTPSAISDNESNVKSDGRRIRNLLAKIWDFTSGRGQSSEHHLLNELKVYSKRKKVPTKSLLTAKINLCAEMNILVTPEERMVHDALANEAVVSRILFPGGNFFRLRKRSWFTRCKLRSAAPTYDRFYD